MSATSASPSPTPQELILSTPAPAVRKVPVPCWTHDETLALIAAYRHRWTALRRGYLRSADWDAVSAAVPSKSSDQCRHKIEKLRQRFRAEKQRHLSSHSSSRFLSAWIFFKPLSFLDDGAAPPAKKPTTSPSAAPTADDGLKEADSGDGFLLTALGLRSFENPSSGAGRDVEILKKRGRSENGPGRSDFRLSPSNDDGVAEMVNALTEYSGSGRNVIIDLDADGRGFNFSGGVTGKLHSSRVTLMPKVAKSAEVRDYGSDGTQEGGGRDVMVEMAASLKQLGDGFLKMERMRMEMAVEFEKARMEVEMKRNEMIMESQRRIVDAFMEVAKAKRVKREVVCAET